MSFCKLPYKTEKIQRNQWNTQSSRTVTKFRVGTRTREHRSLSLEGNISLDRGNQFANSRVGRPVRKIRNSTSLPLIDSTQVGRVKDGLTRSGLWLEYVEKFHWNSNESIRSKTRSQVEVERINRINDWMNESIVPLFQFSRDWEIFMKAETKSSMRVVSVQTFDDVNQIYARKSTNRIKVINTLDISFRWDCFNWDP